MKNFMRFFHKFRRALLLGSLGLTTLGMNGCDDLYWNEQDLISRIKSRQKEIVVLTTPGPLTYRTTASGEAFGIDHDLIANFAEHYQLDVRFVELPDDDAVLRALAAKKGDIAATRLRVPDHAQGFLVGPSYEETQLTLYCHRQLRIQNMKDLAGKKVGILKKDNASNFGEKLLKRNKKIKLSVFRSLKTQELFRAVQQGRLSCLISEKVLGDLAARHFPQIESVTKISEEYSLSWFIDVDNRDLLSLVRAWFQNASRQGEIMRILDRYQGHIPMLNKMDLTRFFKRSREVLPTYHRAFREAASEHQIPWQLVAAVAYQESHWNKDARSFTGVRGLMQLTEETAEHLGVEDRTDPVQSIWGGSKYLRYLLGQTPSHLNKKDRIALALAAYNIGSAHLRDAQRLAQKMGRNPYSWHDLRRVLPLLADPDYAEDLPYGAARGYETVEFVERVKSFYNLLDPEA